MSNLTGYNVALVTRNIVQSTEGEDHEFCLLCSYAPPLNGRARAGAAGRSLSDTLPEVLTCPEGHPTERVDPCGLQSERQSWV